MYTPSPNPVASSHFQKLHALFHSLPKPYAPADVIRFNLVFYRAYPHLTPDEKRYTEAWVDTLLADLGEEDLVCQRGED